MHHHTMQITRGRASGPGPRQLKKLAVLFKTGVGRAGKTTPREEGVKPSLDATACSPHFRIKIRVNGWLAKAMIDSGATGNFMSESFARRNKVPVQGKRDPYQLTVVDRTPLSKDKGRVMKETKSLRLSVHGMTIRTEEFDLVWIPHKVILGLPWLEKQNPRIDWKRRQLVFPDETLVTSEPGVTIKEISLTQWKKYHQRGQACVAWMKPQTQQLCTTQDAVGKTQAPQLPSEYKEYQEMFEETAIVTLPEHQEWDHEIPLEDRKKPTHSPIYTLSAKELEALRNYLDKNLAKGFIRPSTSPAGYPILFVPKKDSKLQLCVDYRWLNAITVKNCYPLPLISEIQDWIQGAK